LRSPHLIESAETYALEDQAMTNSTSDNAGRPSTPPPPPAPRPLVSNHELVMAVYILYLVGFFTGFTALAGVIIAHMQLGRSDPISNTHFQFQIRTFWIGLLYVVVGAISAVVVVGLLILLWWFIWTLVRCIKGLLTLNAHEPIANPKSWLFG
jgi:uncharacterized membrane protein